MANSLWAVYLGGANLPLESAAWYDLVFREAELEISS
jgi:hypothetical protein